LAIGFLCVLLAVETVRRVADFPTPADLAASAAAVAAGKLWLLVTSALIVNGPSWLELPGFFLAVALLIRRYGSGTFWRVAPASHIGSTLVVYAGIGMLLLVGGDSADSSAHRLDYGISGMWLGVLGALFAGSWLASSRQGSTPWDELVVIVCLGGAAGGFFFFPLLSGVEHTLAFAFGAVVLVASSRTRAPQQAVSERRRRSA
jgi:hypothetical protein